MGGFDIYVKTDNTILNPTAAVFGPLLHPSLSIRCINNISVEGTCTQGTANAPGVVEMETIDSSGSNACFGQPTCSGLAFNITYTVQTSTGTTPINYPKSAGCTSSTADPTDCVLVFDNFGTVLTETVQTATYGSAATPPTLVSVVTGTDGNLYYSGFTSPTWGAWQPLNGQSPSSPALCASSPSSTELVVRGSDNGVYHKTFTVSGGFAAAWDKSPSGVTIDRPVCAVLGTTLYVVVRGATTELWATTFDLSAHTWAASWTDLNGFSPSAPALAATSSLNRLDLLARGVDNQIYHKALTSGTWAAAWDTSNRAPVPDKTIATPAIVSDGSILHIVVVGTEANIWYATLTFAGVWSTYTSLAGSTPAAPSLVVDSANALHLVVQGNDNAVYEKAKPSGGAWDVAWTTAGGITAGAPAVTTIGSTVNVVTRGADSRLWYNTLTGTSFSGWVSMNGAATLPPALSTP